MLGGARGHCGIRLAARAAVFCHKAQDMPSFFAHALLLVYLSAAPCSCLPCPPWIDAYSQFHQQSLRSIRNDTQFLLHTCWGSLCGGVGDRLRGAMWSARFAASQRRLLLIDWKNPAPLTSFFVPTSFDWRLDPHLQLFHRSSKSSFSWYSEPPSHVIQNLHSSAFLVLEHNAFESSIAGPNAPSVTEWSNDALCLFRAMFAPTDQVEKQVDTEIAAMFPNTIPISYDAAHLRIGGLVGEPDDPLAPENKLYYFFQTLECLQHIRRSPNHAVLIADNNYVNHMVAHGVVPGVVCPNITATHIERASATSVQEHLSTFVAMGILAKAVCAVFADSGFSRLAFYWGGHQCKIILGCRKGTGSSVANSCYNPLCHAKDMRP